jgi:hypothetical protein
MNASSCLKGLFMLAASSYANSPPERQPEIAVAIPSLDE